jgi:hypothetical protein
LLLDLQRQQPGLLLCWGSSTAEAIAGGISFSFDDGDRCWGGDDDCGGDGERGDVVAVNLLAKKRGGGVRPN